MQPVRQWHVLALRVMATLLMLGAVLPGVATAQASSFDRFWNALQLQETLTIVREEGHSYALEAAEQLTGRPSDRFWQREVDQIYDLERMTAQVRADLQQAMVGRDLGAALTYYESKAGQQVIDLEISARRAYLAPGVDEAAREAWYGGGNVGTRADLIRRIIRDGELIERNVVGALNSNFAFLTAFAQSGPNEGMVLDERAILDEVMSEEDALRLDTAEWLYGYLSLAYGPLSEQALEELAEISDSPAGRHLNDVLFLGFDPMFEDLARRLGVAAGQALLQQDL
ncbi:DUF2059 domain-containing protein [Aliiroseovarius crassostreae]|uniref:DUF2059 domain-containing protein n=2 Tax=Aliiroseovarius crassostreae TaxID=154981 RepID=UPI0022053953|nr:DUF2059 domain-containing protein [Aliiroseovarius crassostreae]UWP99884.1 DUF2059 domain-containing protein [Aliiroseovarius crassostreae]